MITSTNKREPEMKLDQLNHLRNDSRVEFKEEKVKGKKFTIVSHVAADVELWKTPLAKDACGITFNERGDCVCRPFEKIFSVNETDDTQITKLDFNGAILTKKYDGSMITPVLVGDNVVFKSKKSFFSEVAKTANRAASNKLKEFCTTLLVQGITPIFEFMHPKHRIVIDYGARPHFVLIGARRIDDGTYVDIDGLELKYDVPCGVVRRLNFNIDTVLHAIEHSTSEAGFVVVLANGERVKFKTKWYENARRALTRSRIQDAADCHLDWGFDERVNFL